MIRGLVYINQPFYDLPCEEIGAMEPILCNTLREDAVTVRDYEETMTDPDVDKNSALDS